MAFSRNLKVPYGCARNCGRNPNITISPRPYFASTSALLPAMAFSPESQPLASTLLGAGITQAQQAPAPYPLDNVPDKMPFDVPYGPPISLEKAQAAIAAAVAESKKRDWKEAIAVADSGGNLVALQRMDGTQLASAPIAEHKARAAAMFRRDTKAWRAQVWISFGIAVSLCAIGLAYLPGSDIDRAFMMMGYTFCLSSAFALATRSGNSPAAPKLPRNPRRASEITMSSDAIPAAMAPPR